MQPLLELSHDELTQFQCNSDVPEFWMVSVEREFPDLIALKLFMLGSTALSGSQSSKLQQIKKITQA